MIFTLKLLGCKYILFVSKLHVSAFRFIFRGVFRVIVAAPQHFGLLFEWAEPKLRIAASH